MLGFHAERSLSSERCFCVQAYQTQTEYLESPLYKFVGEPDRVTGNLKGQAGGQIELIASPNNPSFQMQEVSQNVTGPVVYDHAYYWPHLAPITKAMDYDIMLFTMSKVTGHAGSRVG
jgi:L-tryptophan--pyruvate aminotransferase